MFIFHILYVNALRLQHYNSTLIDEVKWSDSPTDDDYNTFESLLNLSPDETDSYGPWIPPVKYRIPAKTSEIFQWQTVTSTISIDELVDAYITKHANVASSEKGFITGSYGCPKQWGNRMHEFLNAFAVAVITDRTLLWHYTPQNPSPGSLEECEALLHRQAWIPSTQIIKGKSVTEFGWHYQNGREKAMACAGLEYVGGSAGYEVINLGVIEHFESFSLAADDANLSSEAKSRAKILFAQGPGLAYGKLIQKAFAFDTPKIIDPSEKVLREAGFIVTDGNRISKSYLIGLHIRSFGDKKKVQMFYDPLTNVMKSRPSGSSCGVLFASDQDVDDKLRLMVAEYNCSLVTSDFIVEEETSWSEEHGHHTGIDALRDLTLLSYADKILITCGSTFSQAISEQALRRNPSVEIEPIGCSTELKEAPNFLVGCG